MFGSRGPTVVAGLINIFQMYPVVVELKVVGPFLCLIQQKAGQQKAGLSILIWHNWRCLCFCWIPAVLCSITCCQWVFQKLSHSAIIFPIEHWQSLSSVPQGCMTDGPIKHRTQVHAQAFRITVPLLITDLFHYLSVSTPSRFLVLFAVQEKEI